MLQNKHEKKLETINLDDCKCFCSNLMQKKIKFMKKNIARFHTLGPFFNPDGALNGRMNAPKAHFQRT